jgi:hypothetical protein
MSINNIRFGVRPDSQANGFIDRLQPSDRLALVGIGPGAPSVPFTADHERLRRQSKTTGQRQTMSRALHCDFEAMAVRRGDAMMRASRSRCRIRRPRRTPQRIRYASCRSRPKSALCHRFVRRRTDVNMFATCLASSGTSTREHAGADREGFVLDNQHHRSALINNFFAACTAPV